MKLRAKTEFSYANRLLSPGDEFDASDRDARVLMAVGRAEAAPEHKTRALKAETADEPKKAASKAGKRSGAYNRRDMKAKD